MQTISRRPWSGDQLSGKVLDRALKDLPGSNVFTRKRSVSPETLSTPQSIVKKPRPHLQQRLPLDLSQVGGQAGAGACDFGSTAYATPGPTPTTATARDYPNSKPSGAASMHQFTAPSAIETKPTASGLQSAPSTAAGNLSALRQAIENQINMQILLKHNEARLIDQELAKCQVAYEQLRRCELLPYPGSQHPTESVTTGTGPAILPQSGYSKPTNAAPYGVVDGPYGRHYSKWLLADHQFDSEPARAHYVSDAHVSNRAMRMTGSSVRKSIGKTVPMPAQFKDFPPSLPNYPTAPPKKEKSGPLILRRSTDNKLVKLVCNDCNRGDMNSIQGFLNHCRIAHKVDYKSHDQAAKDCGRPLDDQEIANLPVETQATPVSKPTRSAPARASTASVMPASSGAVHPYNVTGAPIPRSKSSSGDKRVPVKSRSNVSKSTTQKQFKPSSQAPRLSALFAKNNVGGDLDQAIANARQRVDLGIEDDIHSPHASAPSSPLVSIPGGAVPRDPQTSSGAIARPVSRKGHRQPAQRPRPSPLTPAPAQHIRNSEVPESPQDLSMSLSPHTADSNPGLISDMEDDDHGSASEEETAAPPPSRGTLLPVTTRTCSDAMDIDVAVDDEMDEHGVIIRRNSMLGEERTMRPTGGSSTKLG